LLDLIQNSNAVEAASSFSFSRLKMAISIHAPLPESYQQILSAEALEFLAQLHRRFNPERLALLAARKARQARLDAGELPSFLDDTRAIRAADWRVGEIPDDLQDRRVEITGPVERKMIINALNSGAKVFMADFEDSNAPTWANVIEGQINLRDAIAGTISFEGGGKQYRLHEKTATLIVRPRGWHLDEPHLKLDGEVLSGSLVDFGLYLFHSAKQLLAKGTGPYFYLPKLENHREARLWNAVFDFAEDYLGLKRGVAKCTVLIETILACFEMDEILFELKEHIVGLNCGRWDYIFSYIRAFREHPNRILPERAQVTMTQPFLRAYSQLLIKTCHRRGAFAMGGMAAQIPIKNDEEANRLALDKVRADKQREVSDGHDGTWVAHPALVPIAMEIFDAGMGAANQLDRLREDVQASAETLLAPAPGTISEQGVRNNIDVAIQYIAAWLSGQGCVPIHNLMEDAATAEISRAQLWQWHRHRASLSDGRALDRALLVQFMDSESEKLTSFNALALSAAQIKAARALLDELVFQPQFEAFLTLPASRLLYATECPA
jgi:malate synthase